MATAVAAIVVPFERLASLALKDQNGLAYATAGSGIAHKTFTNRRDDFVKAWTDTDSANRMDAFRAGKDSTLKTAAGFGDFGSDDQTGGNYHASIGQFSDAQEFTARREMTSGSAKITHHAQFDHRRGRQQRGRKG